MRIIRLAWDYPEGGKPSFGLQPVYYYLSREQARQGYDVQVVTKATGQKGGQEEYEGVRVHRVPEPFSLNAYRTVRRLGTEQPSSLIHAHATCGVFLAAARETIGLPVVSHVHGCSRSAHMPFNLRFGDSTLGYSTAENWYRYFRERVLWSRADRILAVSESIRGDLEYAYGISHDNVDVVFNGVDTRVFRPLPSPLFPEKLKQFQGKRIVLYVGHFGLRKGVVFLIRAMKAVLKEVPDAALVCIGGVPSWLGEKDYWGYLQKSITENGLDGKVLMLDKVPNKELPTYYSLADVFVLPSYYEAFAKVLVEAMACAKPIVVTKGGGPSEVVRDGESGVRVDYGSEEQLYRAIVPLLQDKGLRIKFGRNARNVVEKNFTWSAVVERISRSYEHVLTAPKARLE